MATLTQPSLDRLILEVRTMLGQLSAKNSFWTDQELTMYLNDSIRVYYQEVEERAEGQFDKVANLDIVSGVETVDLPDDCYEVKALYKVYSDRNEILEYANNLTFGYRTQTSDSSDSYNPSYYFRVNSLVLRPLPNFSETDGLLLEYTAFPETLIWGGDTLTESVSPTFKEMIVLYAVYKAKVRESLTTGNNTYVAVKMMLDECYIKFKDSVGYRSKFPQHIIQWNP